MVPSSAFRRNAFQATLIGLSFGPSHDADIFSRACVEAFDECDWAQFGYPFTQVFEPAVLFEVALLEGVPYERLTALDHRETDATVRLGAMVDVLATRSVVELVNLASALVSISRFDLARRVLAEAGARRTTPREDFDIAWVEFLVTNRCDDGAGSPAAFEKMREAVRAHGVPPSRVLDACTQAVVWYVKRREIPTAEFERWMALGASLAKTPARIETGALSSWYRGVAMVPAATGNAGATRRYMDRAREAAEAATTVERGRAFALNAVKTYYESALKEHLYVRRDPEAAEEAGRALIDLDPAWSPSYGELAEVHERTGRVERAAELYEQAADTGPPYVAHHLLKAATCRERSGDLDRSLAHYATLAELAPRSERVMSGGLAVAERMSHPSTAAFQRGLDQIRAVEVG